MRPHDLIASHGVLGGRWRVRCHCGREAVADAREDALRLLYDQHVRGDK